MLQNRMFIVCLFITILRISFSVKNFIGRFWIPDRKSYALNCNVDVWGSNVEITVNLIL